MMKNGKVVLITGGAGFIGSNLVHYWLKKHKNDRIIVFDALTYAGNVDNLNDISEISSNFKFIKGDISNKVNVDHVLSKHPITHIINMAAETHVDNSIKMPEKFFKSNIKGVWTILEAMRRRGKKIRLIQVSTDEVYGELGNEGYFREDSPIKPSSPYSASKAGGDFLCLAYNRTYNLDVVITRCCNNYGPFQHHEKLIPNMIKNALSGKPLPVYGSGKNIRDWIYANDHCRAIDLVLRKGKAGEVYNIGARHEMKNIDIVRLICNILSKEMKMSERKILSLIVYVKDRPGHDYRYAIDPSKIMRLGFKPQKTFEEGIRNTIKWYLRKWG